jgi:SAM-dependent methyltransferase
MNPKNRHRYRFRKAWSWPSDVEDFIRSQMERPCLHACAGDSDVGDVKLDLYYAKDRKTIYGDIFHPPLRPESFQCIVIDPPWHLPYHLRPRLMKSLRDLLRPNGKLIFNAPWWFSLPDLKIVEVWYAEPRVWRNCPLIIVARRLPTSQEAQKREQVS